jgi:hypothetical protein
MHPSQYASTRGRRLPRSPISSTSGRRPPGMRYQTSRPARCIGLNSDGSDGGVVAAYM